MSNVIEKLISSDTYYIYNPLDLYDSRWRWDINKFNMLPTDKFILVNCASETWGTGKFIESLHDKLKEHNLSFLILSHNPQDHKKNSKILFYPYWYHHSIKIFNQPNHNDTKTYNLSCLNGSPRPHRIVNYFKLLDKNYPKSIVTMHTIDNFITSRDDDYQLDPLMLKEWVEVSSQFADRNKSECSQGPDHKAYTDTYVNLVTETTVSNRLFITEKTWKPIASEQLFLILGNPGTIQFLRDQGVDTFDDYIDHSYDTELDFTKRFDKLHQSLDQLMLSNLEEIYQRTKQRRIDNATRFFTGAYDSQYAKILKECISTQN